MNISEWLDEKEAEDVDVSQIVLPDDLSYDEVPDWEARNRVTI